MTHDATVGFWKTGEDKILDGITQTQNPKPNKYDELMYLSYDRRASIVGGTLASQFSVEPVTVDNKSSDKSNPAKDNVGATLHVQGVPLVRLETPSQIFFEHQLRYVRNYADLRMDRIPEIQTQTYDILSFLGSSYRLDTGQRRHSLEFLELIHGLVIQVTMRVKHMSWAPRPIDMSPNVQPIIQTPVHSSFPSGHATESFALATVLHRLATDEFGVEGVKKLAMPFRIAHRIAVNRTIAGVHFPVDSAAGAMLGVILGDALYSLCATPGDETRNWHPKPAETSKSSSDAPVYTLDFPMAAASDSPLLTEDQDFTLQWMNSVIENDRFKVGAKDKRLTSTGDPILHRMLQLAKDEWA